MEQIELQKQLQALFDEGIYKVVLSKPHHKGRYKRTVLTRKREGYQAERFTETQAFHERVEAAQAPAFCARALAEEYRQLNAWGEGFEAMALRSQKGKITLKRRRLAPEATAPAAQPEHNRQKRYLLPEGTVIPPLVDMGIFTREGKIVRAMYDKYRQINRFLEVVEDAFPQEPARALRIIDFGCGKSYLTFILYYYLTECRGWAVHITGLDLKAEVIAKCNETAARYGYDRLHFERGDIAGYQCEGPVDMVITLHACDTATDYALYHAVRWQAQRIFSVPCCQHELAAQLHSDRLALLQRYGILRERAAALMTDAIRAALLEAYGYRAQVLEFIDLAHTPKNLLIRAVRLSPDAAGSAQRRAQALAQVEALMAEFNLQPTLYRLLRAGYPEA